MRQTSATEGTDGRTRISSTLCGYTSRCVSSRMWAMNFSLRRRAGATELSGEGYVQSRLNALPLGQLVVQADHELRERHVAERTPQQRQPLRRGCERTCIPLQKHALRRVHHARPLLVAFNRL